MKDVNATVLVDLTLDKKGKGLLKSMNKDVRWSVKKAIKEGIVVEEAKDDFGWREYYPIYYKVSKEGGTTPETLEVLKNKVKILFVCKLNGKVIGGAGIRFFDKYDINVPRLYIVSSSPEYWELCPTSLLYWKCIEWAKENGYNVFDLGGWQINARGHLEGVNKFKEKWGKVVYYYNDYPFFHALGRKMIRNSKTARFIWNKLNNRTDIYGQGCKS